MLTEAGLAGSIEEARAKLEKTISDGTALEKLSQMVTAQQGDGRDVYDTSRLPLAPVQLEVPALESGYVRRIEAEQVGLVSMHLGGGRATKESDVDLSVGVVVHKKVGDRVAQGESLATIHAATEEAAAAAVAQYRACVTVTAQAPDPVPFIKEIVR